MGVLRHILVIPRSSSLASHWAITADSVILAIVGRPIRIAMYGWKNGLVYFVFGSISVLPAEVVSLAIVRPVVVLATISTMSPIVTRSEVAKIIVIVATMHPRLAIHLIIGIAPEGATSSFVVRIRATIWIGPVRVALGWETSITVVVHAFALAV
jgi:hypothetical protein